MTESLKNRVEAVLYQKNGFRYHNELWDRNIWKKSKDEIRDYFLNRFHTTMDVVEYYSCMVLLYHTVKNKQLLVEFKDSPQYKRYWNIDDEKNVEGSSIVLTETPNSLKIKQPKITNGIRIIGE